MAWHLCVGLSAGPAGWSTAPSTQHSSSWRRLYMNRFVYADSGGGRAMDEVGAIGMTKAGVGMAGGRDGGGVRGMRGGGGIGMKGGEAAACETG